VRAHGKRASVEVNLPIGQILVEDDDADEV
jgi:hypothetical protein